MRCVSVLSALATSEDFWHTDSWKPDMRSPSAIRGGTETLGELVRDIGPGALAVAPKEAVEFSDVIVVSVPFNRYRELPADGAAGKVVIDTNNYWPPRDGKIDEVESSGSTDGELLQEHMKGARVVKAFNAIGAQSLRDWGSFAGASGG